MTVPRPGRPFHRRVVFLYLLAIVGPTLVLLYLGLRSVQRQAQAVASLTAVNLRLSAERLAVEIEHRVEQLAQACLRDSEIAGLAVHPQCEAGRRLIPFRHAYQQDRVLRLLWTSVHHAARLRRPNTGGLSG